jgi:Arc/MetJ-type ribon-helix-helix transcriptional regulator
MGARKQAISVRIGESDLSRVRRLARRLGARDSDVIRAAIKALLAQWSPLQDATIRGRSLVPLFLENGTELFRYFDLDAPRLESIINEGVSAEARVAIADIELIAMSGLQRSLLHWRLGRTGAAGANEQARGGEEPVEQSLRQYLYEKYVQQKANGPAVGRPELQPSRQQEVA